MRSLNFGRSNERTRRHSKALIGIRLGAHRAVREVTRRHSIWRRATPQTALRTRRRSRTMPHRVVCRARAPQSTGVLIIGRAVDQGPSAPLTRSSHRVALGRATHCAQPARCGRARLIHLSATYDFVAQLEHRARQVGRLAQVDFDVARHRRAEARPLLGPVGRGPRGGLVLAAADRSQAAGQGHLLQVRRNALAGVSCQESPCGAARRSRRLICFCGRLIRWRVTAAAAAAAVSAVD